MEIRSLTRDGNARDPDQHLPRGVGEVPRGRSCTAILGAWSRMVCGWWDSSNSQILTLNFIPRPFPLLGGKYHGDHPVSRRAPSGTATPVAYSRRSYSLTASTFCSSLPLPPRLLSPALPCSSGAVPGFERSRLCPVHLPRLLPFWNRCDPSSFLDKSVLSSHRHQSFFFDWNVPGQPYPIPVTRMCSEFSQVFLSIFEKKITAEQCETIHITWARSTATGYAL